MITFTGCNGTSTATVEPYRPTGTVYVDGARAQADPEVAALGTPVYGRSAVVDDQPDFRNLPAPAIPSSTSASVTTTSRTTLPQPQYSTTSSGSYAYTY